MEDARSSCANVALGAFALGALLGYAIGSSAAESLDSSADKKKKQGPGPFAEAVSSVAALVAFYYVCKGAVVVVPMYLRHRFYL